MLGYDSVYQRSRITAGVPQGNDVQNLLLFINVIDNLIMLMYDQRTIDHHMSFQ